MADIKCARCDEIWDSQFLKGQAVSLVPQHGWNQFRVLSDLGTALLNEQGRLDSRGATYPWALHSHPVTEAFRYWSSSRTLAETELSAAAARLVNHAILRSVSTGRGCLNCRFRLKPWL